VQLIMVGVSSFATGQDALDRLDDAVASGAITTTAAALVSTGSRGKVKIHQTRDRAITTRIEELRSGGADVSYSVIPSAAQGSLRETLRLGTGTLVV